MLKDANCTCDTFCECNRYDPCGCEGMDKDPHCLDCCQHLTPEHEERWRTGVAGWNEPNEDTN
jgi:hypothetical protein